MAERIRAIAWTFKKYFWRFFMIMLKAVKMFETFLVKPLYFISDKTVNLSHKHIHMDTQFSWRKTFTWNIFLSIELPFQKLLEFLIKKSIKIFKNLENNLPLTSVEKSLYIKVHCFIKIFLVHCYRVSWLRGSRA